MTNQPSPAEQHRIPATPLLTVSEVCERLRLSDRHVRRLIAEGRLRAVRLIGLRAIRVRENDVASLITRTTSPSRQRLPR